MGQIVSHNDWMRGTAVTFSRRSTKLKSVDDALKNLHEREKTRNRPPVLSADFNQILRDKDVKRLGDALAVWMKDRADYRSSSRNQGQIVERLISQVSREQRFSKAEQQAINELVKSRKTTLSTMLNGSHLTARSFSENTKKASDRYAIGRGTAKIMEIVYTVVKDAFGTDVGSVDSSVLGSVGTSIMEGVKDTLGKELVEALPLIGTVASLATAVYQAGRVCEKAYQMDSLADFARKLPKSDARSAIRACEEALDRELNAHARSGVRSAVSAGTGLANALSGGTASAASTAVSAANTIAAMIDKLYQMGRDYKEAVKVNALIEKRQWSPDIFTACPLIGAYYLTSAPTSEIALMFVNIGGPGWMTDVEQLKKNHLDGVLSKAKSLVGRSRYRLVPGGGGKFAADCSPSWYRTFTDKKF